jgi:copper transport protein
MLAAIAAVAVLGNAPSALAHASLSSAQPGYRERVDRAPASVVLRFSQVVAALPNGIVVRSAGGRVVSEIASLGSDRRSLRVRLGPLTRGPYTVRWQTLSVSDGHVVSGVYTFGVGVDAPPPTEAVGARGPGVADRLVRWVAYVGLAALVGGLALRLVVLPRELPRRVDQVFFALVGGAAIVSMDSALVGLLLRADAALQLPFARFLYSDMSPFVTGTRLGAAWVWTTLGVALVGGLLSLAWLTGSRRALWVSLGVSLALVASFSLSGHSASSSSGFEVVVDWIHATAASIWVGGLGALAVVAWRLDALARRDAFMRFSRLATVLVGIVLAGGIYLALLRLQALSDLWTSTYGRVLLLKLSLVATALMWGAFHHLVARPRLVRDENALGGRVGRSLVGESIVGVAILFATAALVNARPPDPRGGAEAAATGASQRPPTAPEAVDRTKAALR